MKYDMDKIIAKVGVDKSSNDPRLLPSSDHYQIKTQVEIRDTLEMLLKSQDEEEKRNKKRFTITTVISCIAAIAAVLSAIPAVHSLLRTLAALFGCSL